MDTKYSERDYRGYTISRLEKIIDGCLAKAKSNKVQLIKKGSNGKCFGIIKEGEDTLFVKEYTHRYDFVNTAHMFMDFHFLLEYISKVTIRTRNDRNRRFGDLKGELTMCYNIHRIIFKPEHVEYNQNS